MPEPDASFWRCLIIVVDEDLLINDKQLVDHLKHHVTKKQQHYAHTG